MFKQTKDSIIKIFGIFCALFVLAAFVTMHAPVPKVHAAPSTYLNFQGRLLNNSGNLVPDGYYNIEFKLFDAASSSGSSQGSCSGDSNCKWVETYYDSNGVTAGNDNRLRVVNGYFSVKLGSLTAFSGINWDQQMWLTMNIGGSTQTATPTYDGEMSPRIQLTAVPLAFVANNVNSGSQSAASTNSPNVSIASGNATGSTSNSGNISIDAGTATGTAGTISLGATNASSLILGRSGLTTLNTGNLTVQGGTTTLGTTGQAGSLVVSDGSSSTITLKSATQVAATNYDITVPAITANDTICLQTFANCSGSATTLQASYDADVDGSDTIISLTTADDSLIFRNPSSSGTDSTYILTLDQLNTGAKGNLSVSNAGTGALISLAQTNTSGTQTDGLLINRNGAGGTTTNLLNLTRTSGTATNAITITGTFSKILNAPNVSIDNSGDILVQAGTDTSTSLQVKQNGGSNVFVVDANNSRVGIGSSAGSPSATLQVAGTFTTAGGTANINVSSSNATNINTGTGSGNVGILNGSGTGTIGIGNSAAGVITIQGGSTIGITGTTTITGRSTGDALTVSNSTSTGNIFVAKDNSTAVFTIEDGGDVGIGATPASNTRLTVDNNATGEDLLSLRNNGTAVLVVQGSGIFDLSPSANNDNLFVVRNQATAVIFNIDTNETTGGNVGINTSGPGARLDVQGSSSANSTVTLRVDHLVSTGNIVEIKDGGSNVFLIADGGAVTAASNVTIQGGTATLGTTGQAGSLIVSDGSSSTITFKSATQVAATNYDLTVPAITGNDTLCLVTLANCAGGGGANTALSNLASTAINVSLLPGADDTIDLGDNTHRFANAFLGGETLHIGTSTSDEGTISYTTSSNDFNLQSTGNISIGTSDTTGTLFVLDTKTGSGDPSGVAGGMYYNSNSGKFRCYEVTTWKDCVGAGGGSGVTTVGSFSGSSQTDGANITGTTITFGPADATNPGMVSTGTQTFAGDKTFTGTMLQKSDSATALTLQDSTGTYNNLLFNSSTNHLRLYDHTAPRTAYLEMYYGGGEGVLAASTGATRVGNGTGDVNVTLTNNSEKFNVSHTGTNAGSGDIDVYLGRNITGTSNNLQGSVVKIEDLSTYTSGSSAPNVLYVNQNNTGAAGNLIIAKTGGSTTQFSVSTAGAVTAAGLITGQLGLAITGATTSINASSNFATNINTGTSTGAISIGNSAAGAITLQSGSNITLGTSDSTGTLLVLDDKTGTGDPTSVNGGMYYNSALHSFRCARDGFWSDCAINEIDHSYNFEDDFIGGAVGATTGPFGDVGWGKTGTCTANTYNTQNAGLMGHDHPGVIDLKSGAASGNICAAGANANTTVIAADDVIKTTASVTGTLNNVIYRTGWTNQGTTASTRPTSGVWWEADNTSDTNWQYCYANNAAATCADNSNATPTIAANTWVKLEIRIVSSSAVDFIYNGTKISLTGLTIDLGGTNKLAPLMGCGARTAAVQTCEIDYFQWRGVVTTSGGR